MVQMSIKDMTDLSINQSVQFSQHGPSKQKTEENRGKKTKV